MPTGSNGTRKQRGEVWWGPAPHKSSPAYRPWLIVSDGTTPFADVEAIALALTTQDHDAGIEVPADAWTRGGSRTDAFVSPWYVTTLKHRDLEDQQGALDAELVTRAVERLHEFVPASTQ